jgi:hypothetical protein
VVFLGSTNCIQELTLLLLEIWRHWVNVLHHIEGFLSQSETELECIEESLDSIECWWFWVAIVTALFEELLDEPFFNSFTNLFPVVISGTNLSEESGNHFIKVLGLII